MTGDVGPEFLEGIPLVWNLGRATPGQRPDAWPAESAELERARWRQQVADTAARHQGVAGPERGPQKPGTSHLERFEGSPIEMLAEIHRLASDIDQPYAWRALANGWRIPALREPLKDAIRDVGWERFHRIVRDWPRPEEWPEGLLAFLEEEKRRDHARKTAKRAERAVPWNDYSLMDD